MFRSMCQLHNCVSLCRFFLIRLNFSCWLYVSVVVTALFYASAAYVVNSSCGVCLSVRMSVRFVDHVKTNKHIIKIFSPSGSHAILVFPCQTAQQYSNGNPLMGASNAGGRNRDSEPISGLTACVNAATGTCCKRDCRWTATVLQVMTYH